MAAARSSKDPCAAHREAQAKYVAKNRQAQRDRVKRHYQKNKPRILAAKKAARKKSGGSRRTRGGGSGGGGGGKTGRPRTGCKASRS